MPLPTAPATPAHSRVLVTKGAGAAAALGVAEAAQQQQSANEARLEKLKAAAPAAAPEEAGASAAPAAAGAEEEGAGNAGPGAEAALRQALEELLLAEEAFDLVADKQLLQAIDNVAMLLLDIVWCSYLLRDVGRLGVSAERLARARGMLARAHGPNLERLRQLHGGSPESATYVRLEAMEGVVAFHVGDRPAAARSLRAAQERYDRLQVSPQSLAMLQEMGYHTQESSRALRFCSGDVAAAVSFIGEQRAKQRERAADRKRQRAWHSERAQYGKTQRGAYVDREPLEQLVTLGYERALAAEALRAADNDMHARHGDRVKAGALQLAILARQIQEAEQGPQDVQRKHVRRLVEMGFGERDARVALKAAGGSFRRAVERLAGRGDRDEEMAGAGGGAGDSARRGGGCSSRRGASGANGAGHRRGGGNGGGGSDVSGSSSGESSAEADSEEERLERSLVDSVRGRGGGDDPTAAYDVDLEEEAEAIRRYTALLQHPSQ
ncbi:NEDD8 ultimate buster 1 [Monoraphidium neglectum]|uniref:NEDD8 ultimate buster 1 n=1 Tax=Monoraphidium neglectum TaxID=145388 RepID=A0A0D2LGT0_9CHLO|nr:NEDD8 ultimate buster 1 [Monoraphidium neglectum]KIZ05684.1 NEDD8 ultimate buster 1 [Monoraphidium neglectum]|eukprot:XP_013904703.1 NEDD8 ultimate buster 1 [Monoraphidium neglectum]